MANPGLQNYADPYPDAPVLETAGTWPWHVRKRGRQRTWQRHEIKAEVEKFVAQHNAIRTQAARDAIAMLADCHYTLYLASQAIEKDPFDPRLGKADAYREQRAAYPIIVSAYKILGLWPLKPVKSEEPSSDAEDEDVDFSQPLQVVTG